MTQEQQSDVVMALRERFLDAMPERLSLHDVLSVTSAFACLTLDEALSHHPQKVEFSKAHRAELFHLLGETISNAAVYIDPFKLFSDGSK